MEKKSACCVGSQWLPIIETLVDFFSDLNIAQTVPIPVRECSQSEKDILEPIPALLIAFSTIFVLRIHFDPYFMQNWLQKKTKYPEHFRRMSSFPSERLLSLFRSEIWFVRIHTNFVLFRFSKLFLIHS